MIRRKGPNIAFVVIYSHGHGTDVWVCKSHRAAMSSVMETITEYLGDVEDGSLRSAIHDHILLGEYEQALQVWSGYQQAKVVPESFEIETKVLIGVRPKKALRKMVSDRYVATQASRPRHLRIVGKAS